MKVAKRTEAVKLHDYLPLMPCLLIVLLPDNNYIIFVEIFYNLYSSPLFLERKSTMIPCQKNLNFLFALQGCVICLLLAIGWAGAAHVRYSLMLIRVRKVIYYGVMKKLIVIFLAFQEQREKTNKE